MCAQIIQNRFYRWHNASHLGAEQDTDDSHMREFELLRCLASSFVVQQYEIGRAIHCQGKRRSLTEVERSICLGQSISRLRINMYDYKPEFGTYLVGAWVVASPAKRKFVSYFFRDGDLVKQSM